MLEAGEAQSEQLPGSYCHTHPHAGSAPLTAILGFFMFLSFSQSELSPFFHLKSTSTLHTQGQSALSALGGLCAVRDRLVSFPRASAAEQLPGPTSRQSSGFPGGAVWGNAAGTWVWLPHTHGHFHLFPSSIFVLLPCHFPPRALPADRHLLRLSSGADQHAVFRGFW